MSNDPITQCLLEQNGWKRISWVPKKLAIKGNVVSIKNDNNWTILEVYSTIEMTEFQKQQAAQREFERLYFDINYV